MAAIGLKTQIWNNNVRSLLLLGLYPFLLCFLFWAIAFLAGWCLGVSVQSYNGTGMEAMPSVQTGLAFSRHALIKWWPSVFALTALWFLIAYFFQTKMIRALSHGKPVMREQEPVLYNLLENLCISRGLPMPGLEIIETAALNAFASGVDQNSYTITVTRGLLESLQKDEIEAVLGHELTHITNGDVRLLIVSIIFTGMIGFFAQMIWSSIRYNFYTGRRRRGNGRSDGRILLLMMAVAALLWVGYMATLLARFALSRRREYMADAGSVELTKNPDAMMRALLRIAGKDRMPGVAEDIALMCIENAHPFMGLFATHPPIEERIKILSQVTGTPVPSLDPVSSKNPWR